MKVDRSAIEECKKDDVWALGNKVLYDLCAKHPHHTKEDEIVAKIWLIGRSYAAAIERRKPIENEPRGDDFYTKMVVPALEDPKMDNWLDDLKSLKPMSTEAISLALKIHKHLTIKFANLSRSNKRSLASKYLHFHLPNHFFLYDNRALSGLRELTKDDKHRLQKTMDVECDKEYSKFYNKMVNLKRMIIESKKIDLNPRQMDRLLLRHSKFT